MKYRKEYVKWDVNTTERILMAGRIRSAIDRWSKWTFF